MTGYIEEQSGDENAGKWDIATVPGGGGNWGGSFLAVPTDEREPGDRDRAGRVPDQREASCGASRPGQPAVEPDAVRRRRSCKDDERVLQRRPGRPDLRGRRSQPGAGLPRRKNIPVRDAVENALRSVEARRASRPTTAGGRIGGRAEKAARRRLCTPCRAPTAVAGATADGADSAAWQPPAAPTPDRRRAAAPDARRAVGSAAGARARHGRAVRSSSSPFFILFAVFGLFPLGYTFWVSLHDWSLLGRPRRGSGSTTTASCSRDERLLERAASTPSASSSVATVPQLHPGARCWRHVLNQRLRGRTFWRMGVLLPNITSVAAVGIIFSADLRPRLRDRELGCSGHVGVDADQLAGRTAGRPGSRSRSMVDWRWTGYNALILLAALQAVPAGALRGGRASTARRPWRQFWSHHGADAAADADLRRRSSPRSAASSCSPSR